MQVLRQEVQVSYRYNVYLTKDMFSTGPRKVLVVIDDGVARACPQLIESIEQYFRAHENILHLCESPVIVHGGEAVKNSFREVTHLHELIHAKGLCRHSYLIAIGGGAVLDMAGFAAATAHRGIRHVRVPTTVLSQDDSGVGVKNGINSFGKKNFLGTFAPPYAVINDAAFLEVLSNREWCAGIAEAIKVSLIKDAAFFAFLEQNAQKLVDRNMVVMQQMIARCAELHLHHIAQGGDPFEFGSARPLDYGHWSAHKLEQLSNYQLRHGEAVAIGIALDTTYAYLKGLLPKTSWQRTLTLIQNAHLPLWSPELSAHLDEPDHPRCVMQGLQEFREHLGGELTIILLKDIGQSVTVNEIDEKLMHQAAEMLKQRTAAQERPSFDAVCTGD
jgi:3-dehydroquinate synthase